MAKEIIISSYVQELLVKMDEMSDSKQLSMFIRNMQVVTSTFFKNDSLSDPQSSVTYQVKLKLEKNEKPSVNDFLDFALEVEKIFVKSKLL